MGFDLSAAPRSADVPVARRAAAGLALAALCGLVPVLATAADANAGQASGAQVPEVVIVTATRMPEALSRTLADVSVLDRSAIERSGAAALADLLASLPGVALTRNGGPGAVTGVSLRGSETRHVAVFIDGLRVDTQTTGGAQWELMPLDDLARIEVLRGPAAAVYGSDAVGGVVQLFTRRGSGSGGVRVSAGVDVGSHDSLRMQAAHAGSAGSWDHALAVSAGGSRGQNATASGNPDRDGWRRAHVQARVGLAAAPGQRVDASVLLGRLRARYDGFGADDDIAREALQSLNLVWAAQWAAGWDSRLQWGQTLSHYDSKPADYRTETRLRDLQLSVAKRLAQDTWSLTVAHREDALHNPATAWTPALKGNRRQTGLALGWHGQRGAHALQIHLRHDDDSGFGGHSAGSAGWGIALGGGWRATVSASTAFRAPTLYQRFSEYGSANLQPETARQWEVGLRWGQGGQTFSLSGWRQRVEQLIDFGAPGGCASAWGCYANTGRAALDGATLAARQRWGALQVDASLDWLDARNRISGQVLPRRAREAAKLDVSGPWAAWRLGGQLQASSHRVEYDFSGKPRRLAGHGLLSGYAERPLGGGWRLLARIDNLADKRWETAAGYPMPGRRWQLGLRWAPTGAAGVD